MPKGDRQILVIDDFALSRYTIRQALLKLGIPDILEAKNGREGLDVLKFMQKKGKPVQLIISDLNMPEMTGLELLRYVRSQKEFQSIPFIVLTVEGEESTKSQAIQAGASAYLYKPLSLPLIMQNLTPFLEKLK